MVYANVVLAAGAEAFALRARGRGRGRADRARPAARRGGRAARRLRRRGDRAGAARGADHARPERVAAIGADARGFVYAVSLTGTTGERDELPPGLGATVERVRGDHRRAGRGRASGSRTGEQARAVAELADGVIVGSRVVRAAGEGGAAAVGSGRGELAAALR